MSNENVTVVIDRTKLSKLITESLDNEKLNNGLRKFAFWVQGEVQNNAPIDTGALRSSTIIDDPEYLSAITNRRGDTITAEKVSDLNFQVRQAIDYAKKVFERNRSESGEPKILLTAGTNGEQFEKKFKEGFEETGG